MAIIPGQLNKESAFETPQQKKTKKMIYLLAAVVLITAGVLYFGFQKTPATQDVLLPGGTMLPGGLPSSQGESNLPAGQGAALPSTSGIFPGGTGETGNLLPALKDIDLNNPVFKDKKFQSLVPAGQLPIDIGTKGREDPFAPF